MQVQQRMGDLRQPERADAAAEAPAPSGCWRSAAISALKAQEERAEFLASINLSETRDLGLPAQDACRARPARATKVIITEYDLPRDSIEPHDVIVGKDGMVWYTNFGEQNIGRLDPKTGKVTEIALPELKKGWPQGSPRPAPRQGRQSLVRHDVPGRRSASSTSTSQKVETFSLPPEMNKDMAQVNMVRPESATVDGKVWSQNNGFAAASPPRPQDRRDRDHHAVRRAPRSGENHNIYDIIPDAKNNVYFTDFAQQHLGRVDAKTGQTTLFELPTKASAPRRGMMDAQGRIWFGLYRANKIDDVRHQDREVQGMGNADRVVGAL